MYIVRGFYPGRAQPCDPQVARAATRGRVRTVEDVARPQVDINPEIDQGAETPDAKFDHEKVVLVRRRRYKNWSILQNCPLGNYDTNEILDARSQGDSWVSPASTLSNEDFSKVHASGVVRGINCAIPCRDYQAHRLPLGWLACQGEHQWLDGTKNSPMSKVCEYADKYFIAWDVKEESQLWTKTEMTRGQALKGPTRPVPTSKGKGMTVVEDSDSSSFDDDDMSSKLRRLTGGPSNEPAGRVRAKGPHPSGSLWIQPHVPARAPEAPQRSFRLPDHGDYCKCLVRHGCSCVGLAGHTSPKEGLAIQCCEDPRGFPSGEGRAMSDKDLVRDREHSLEHQVSYEEFPTPDFFAEVPCYFLLIGLQLYVGLIYSFFYFVKGFCHYRQYRLVAIS
uniref:Uncharacterized protein n=1 Tax=Cannabis sativa TaxID=3483 RepID=A0A803PSM4_CANSA